MFKITDEQIAKVMEITNYPKAKAEKYIKEYYADMEDETATFEDIFFGIECEMKAKANGTRNYIQSDKPRKAKAPKTVVVSDEKMALFDLLWEGLSNFYGENAQIIKQNKEISVQIGEKSFKIDLVEHRKPKN